MNGRAAIFYTTVPQQSFMTFPLMEFCHCSDVTQNPPQSPSNHVKDRTPFFHRCSLSTAFPPKDDGDVGGGRSWGRFDSIFASILCRNKIRKKKIIRGQRNQIRGLLKAFPRKSITIYEYIASALVGFREYCYGYAIPNMKLEVL